MFTANSYAVEVKKFNSYEDCKFSEFAITKVANIASVGNETAMEYKGKIITFRCVRDQSYSFALLEDLHTWILASSKRQNAHKNDLINRANTLIGSN